MPQKKDRILFCVSEDYYFAIHRFQFAQEAIKKGYEVAVACRISDKREMFEKAGIRVFPIPFNRESLSPFVVFKACLHIRRLIRAYQPQILHAIALRAIFLTWMATLGMKRPPILNAVAGFGLLYSGELKSWKLKIVRWVADILLKRLFKHSSAYNVLQNNDDLQILLQQKLTSKERAFLIRGVGVVPSSWSPKNEETTEKPVILFVGRLLKDKGLGALVEASQILRGKNLLHVIRVIGEVDACNPESFSKEDIQRWHDSGSIEWLGQRDDVLSQMTQASIVALPSYYREGLPKVLLEAGLAQRAVITCDSIGCREVVHHMDNGLLVPPRDAVALAVAIEKLLKDSALRLRLAKRNYEKICTEFSSDIIHQQFFNLYEKMLKKSSENPSSSTHKIAFVVNAAYTLCLFRLGVMRRLRDIGHEIVCITPTDERSDELTQEGFRVIPLKLDRDAINPFKDFFVIRDLYRIYKEEKFDAVFQYTIKINIYGSLAARMTRTPSFNIIPGLGYAFSKKNFLNFIAHILYKIALLFPRKVIFLNEDDQKEFFERKLISQNQALLMHSEGVNTEYYAPIEAGAPRSSNGVIFIFLGRFLRNKGLEELVEAFKSVQKHHSNAELWLLGRIDYGNPQGIAEETIRSWAINAGVKYLGETKDVRPFISQSDICVYPSYYREGVPRGLLEAMSMSKPIITTDSVGCRDVVEDGENGFMVQPRDVNSLTRAMMKMLELTAEDRSKMGKYGREKVLREFDEKKIINVYMELMCALENNISNQVHL